jgi:hypothetical protein
VITVDETTSDQAKAIRDAAIALHEAIALKLGDLADLVLGRPELGSPEWLAERLDEDRKDQRLREWHLTKMAIRREAGELSQVGDVLNARSAGATWEAIGEACGMTASAAEEKWASLEKGIRARQAAHALDGLEGEDLG